MFSEEPMERLWRSSCHHSNGELPLLYSNSLAVISPTARGAANRLKVIIPILVQGMDIDIDTVGHYIPSVLQ